MKRLGNEFGKALRRQRVMRGETLGDTSDAIGVSAAMLSGIELGRKAASEELVGHLIEHFELDGREATNFRDFARSSRKSINLDMSNLPADHRNTAAVFARRFSELSGAELRRIRSIMEPDVEEID